MTNRDPFPNYLAMPSRLSLRFWHAIRFLSIAGLIAVAVGGVVRPADTLTFFWGIVIPVLPVVFLIAPGSWRNVCPLAGLNQSSRYLGVTKQVPAPAWLRDHGFSIATTLFFGIALTRKVLFNRNGVALTVLLGVVMVGALLGGRFFRGKSGWCSSICPLLPVQRVYGQTPFIGVANSHCRPCLGCTKNCYDFNPRVAYVADMHEPDATFRGSRRLFVGAFPGLVLGFFLVPDAGQLSTLEVYGRCLLWIAGGIAVFAVLDTFGRFSPNRLPPLFGAAAFSLFYWFGSVRVAKALGSLLGGDWGVLIAPVRVSAFALAFVWLLRSWRVQRQYVEQVAVSTPVRVDLGRARSALHRDHSELDDGVVEIEFATSTIAVSAGTTILDAIERAELPIESGCRMGVCGADPVAVTSGYDRLSPIRREETDTLERLGLGAPNRMACVARAEGSCAVSLAPDLSSEPLRSAAAFDPDPSVQHVVVVGNGIAGVTTADFVRRSHPDCEITLIGAEAHQLYNRMGVARLIHGRSAMQGLYLLPGDWYQRNRVTVWLNTRVTSIDREQRSVVLGTGERVPYDRLVLATGGRATLPPIDGFGIPGCFVLREANDAMQMRAYGQEQDEHRAVVAGGGLLGLEAAHALLSFGMSVTVLERSPRLLRNSLDPVASELLRSYFETLGITVITESEVSRVEGVGRLQCVVTATGARLEAELLLVAAGVSPNITLAAQSGLKVGRGVLVDDEMRTSDPNIFAVGDVAEFNGRTWGLWPVAVSQAQVAAANAVGGLRLYADELPNMILKGVGLDVVSFGRIEANENDHVIAERGGGGHTYRRIVLHENVPVGGVFLGFGDDAQHAQDAHAAGRRLESDEVERLAAGDWSPLERRKPADAR